ncbi:COG4223 family protein [Palleronia sp.]|uniref:COG4223 family protein n=1 Tax=Palleronia sp. TaxID=1940284 RepID=UPI0035C7D2FE
MTNETETTPDEPTPETRNTAETTERTELPERSGGGGPFLAVLVGGFLAGAAGYVAAYYTEFGLFQQPESESPIGAISESLDTQAERLAALEAELEQASEDPSQAEMEQTLGQVNEQVATLSERLQLIEGAPAGEPVDLTPVSDRLAELEGQIADLQEQTGQQAAQIEEMSQSDRLDQLSQRVEELSSTVQSQAQTIEQQQQEIQNAAQSAEAEANRIAVQGALTGIRAALDTGEAYADEIGALREASDVTVPEGLAAPAEEGVPTLNGLRQSFPEAAREALSDSIAATAGEGVADRFGAFIRAQTGARSLDEQAGDGPDAILSRAEARLNEGDLQAALDEIATLPEAGQEALSGWTARARERLAATQGLSELNSSVTN